jgi:hypothetical protein
MIGQPYQLYVRSLASIRGFFIGRPLSAPPSFCPMDSLRVAASPREVL